MFGLGGVDVVWSRGGTEEDGVLEQVVGVVVEVEELCREEGLEQLGLVHVVGDVLVEELPPEMGAGRRTGEICLTG